MSLATLLALGRVSNLPTVWTNTVAAAVLAGGLASPPSVLTMTMVALVMLALSLLYCGGMFLNDAFDRNVDAVERPHRPIPSGRASASAVYVLGGAQLMGGLGLLVLVARTTTGHLAPALAAGTALVVAIVAYDATHRTNPFSPWLMAMCRALVYVCTATATTPTPVWPPVLLAAAGLAVYTAGITYVSAVEASTRASRAWPVILLIAAPAGLVVSSTAWSGGHAWGALASVAWTLYALRFATRGENPNVPGGVMRLIAGMCVLDAAWIASTGAFAVAAMAAAGLPATRLLQRRVAGS